MLRVRLSRAICRWLRGYSLMLCSDLHYRGHWAERAVDALALALLWQRNHCARSAQWEEAQARPEGGFVDAERRAGRL